jgi:hypothetical protein
MQGLDLNDQQMIIRMERLNAEAVERSAGLQRLIDRAEGIDTTANPTSIVNLIDNSDFDWSKDRFLNNPALGGDIDFECFNWFRHPTTDTQLIEDAAHALKYTGHSLYAANEGADGDIPRWERPNGWPEIGAVGATQWDIACPLPENFVRPGRGRFYVQMQASRRTATALPAGVQVYAGFWDNTAGQRKWIEGGTFTLTAARVGAAGATSRQFKIIGTSDYGSQIESNVVTVADSVASLSTSNYVRLGMSGAPGFIQFDIYELVGVAVSRIGQIFNSIDVSYNHYDIAPKVNVGGSFPTVTLTRARAYAETDEFDIADGVWTVHDLSIPIPPTYDVSLTTDKQWFRIGLKAATTDARQVLLDRIGVSLGFGDWAPSSRRPANTLPSTSMTGSNQGPAPPGGTPPGDGEGGPRCWVIEGCEIPVLHGKEEAISSFEDLRITTRIVSDGLRPNTLIGKKQHTVDETYLIATANGLQWRFTETHRLRRNIDNDQGTPVSKLKVGDSLITRRNGLIEETTITESELIQERVEVGSVRLGPGHWLWVNGFASHNAKNLEML